MSDARSTILSRIAAAHGRPPEADAPEEVSRRLRERPMGPQLHWQDSDRERFLARLHAASATVDRVADLGDAAAALEDYLNRERLEDPAVLAPHPLLHELPLPGALRRALSGDDRTAVTVAFAGVAETGSLALLSGSDTPTAYNFLPEHLVCVLEAKRIVANLEDLWARIRAERGTLPRTVNLVTGPSRTADVEQTIQLGAHGPRRLHVLLLEGEA